MDSDFRVGNWVVRPERLCIQRTGATVHLTPKCMAVLQVLARAHGTVVSRNDILDTVWPGAVVTDDVLTHCIVELRKAFDDSAQDQKIVQTIPKKGFRLIPKVELVEHQSAKRSPGWRYASAITVLALAGAIAVWHAGRPTAPPLTVDGTQNAEAFDAFLAGDDSIFGDEANAMRALSHYERATELDPNFALAWARMAEACWVASWNWGEGEPYMLLERRDRAIETALRLAPDSPDVLATSALVMLHREQYREARLALDDLRRRQGSQRALTAIASADLSLKMGALADAYREIRLVLEIDPANRRLPTYLSHYYLLVGRPEDGLAVLESLIEGKADAAGNVFFAANMALATGRRDEIEKWLRRYIDEMPDKWLDYEPPHVALLDRLDDRDAMLEYLHELQSRDSNMDYLISSWSAYFGDDAMALESLRRSPDLWFIWHPVLSRVRATDEFKQIVIDAGLVDYWREFGWGNFCSPIEDDDFECH